MKATQFTELFATIRTSFVSFFAILMFVALGVGVFCGLYWSAPALEAASNQLFEDQNLYNFSLSYPLGFSDEDRDEILALEDVDEAVFSRESYETYIADDDRYTIKLQTLTESVNDPIIVEGNLPTADDELALKADTAQTLGLSVGDTMTFESGSDAEESATPTDATAATAAAAAPAAAGMDPAAAAAAGLDPAAAAAANGAALSIASLNQHEFTITALVENPEYLAHDTASFGITPAGGAVDGIAWIPDGAFNPAAFNNGYPTIYVGSDSLKALDGFSAEYTEQADAIQTRIADLGKDLVKDKTTPTGQDAPAWTVSTRSTNGGISMIDTTKTMTNHLSFSMASLFVIVGLLVTYSTVSRLAHEQIIQIGTKKALGLRNQEITVSFLLYAIGAVIAGVIVGLIAAVYLVEGIIINAIGGRFILGLYAPYFGIWLALIAAVVELVLILVSAWFACKGILRGQAVSLLAGEKPPSGKTRFYERWGLWQRLPLYTQTIVNNCINDKRRVVSTIIGVAGVTALVACAVTLNNDIQTSFNSQYGTLYHYDTVVTYDPAVEDAEDAVDDVLKDKGLDPVAVSRRTLPIELPDGSPNTATVIVPQSNDDFASVVTIRPTQITDAASDLENRDTQNLLTLDGAWVSEAYANNLGATVGDDITITALDGTEAKVPIVGFFEFYLPHYEIVLSSAAYKEAFDSDATANAALTLLKDGVSDADLRKALDDVNGFERVIAEKEQQGATYSSLTSVTTAVVLIYLALSVLMAVVVLLNLNVMFIEEKKRELIVLMINGFSTHAAKRYIYNDSILLTIIGIIVGLVLGALLGSLSVLSIQSNTMHFFSGIDWIAIAAGFVCSGVLATVMAAIALRRIPRFNLTDINKL